ncbi:hypothetical protein SMD22_00615 (plasmid) [Brevibacillus halotolerans]|nr:hypothetical protein SMD22_00615 [Brevibacillus halotolerans]
MKKNGREKSVFDKWIGILSFILGFVVACMIGWSIYVDLYPQVEYTDLPINNFQKNGKIYIV